MSKFIGIIIYILLLYKSIVAQEDDNYSDSRELEIARNAKSTTTKDKPTTDSALEENFDFLFNNRPVSSFFLFCMNCLLNQTSQSSAECSETEKCVPFYLCDNGTVKTDGRFIIKPRFGGIEEDELPCKPLQMCCLKSNFLSQANRQIITTSDPFDESPEVSELATLIIRTDKCGVHNYNGVGEVVNAPEGITYFGEFPWMVAIFVKKRKFKVYQSGGSLIHPKIVLSHASRLTTLNTRVMYARAGEWEMKTEDESQAHQDRSVESVIIHEGYKKAILANDISLLILTEAFETDTHINTVCLPPPGKIFDNQLCIATGWGKPDLGRRTEFSRFLKKKELEIVSRNSCEDSYKSKLGSLYKLPEGTLCAG